MSARLKTILLAVGMMLSATLTTRAQGYGFYIGDKYIQLNEGDKVTFSENTEQTGAQEDGSFVTDIKVETTEGEVTVYQATQIVFQGDIENYFQALRSWLLNLQIGGAFTEHYAWGYGSIMHIRDMMTADMARDEVGYNWYSAWMKNTGIGKNFVSSSYVYSYYQNGVAAANALIAALKPATVLTTEQNFYLSMAYAFRALTYLDMAQMYEYLPTEGTPNHEFGGADVTGLTVPIVREDVTSAEGLPRATREEMVQFILSDLAQAEAHIADLRRVSKMFPNLYCVYGLYARLYMWIGDYKNAAVYAGKVLKESGLEPLKREELINPRTAFNDMSARSWMWGIAPAKGDAMVEEENILNWGGWMCNETTYGYSSLVPVRINPDLVAKMSATDYRRAQFKLTGEENHAGYNFDELPIYASLKFRPYQGECDNSYLGAQANYPIMRLEEMYFIQAEALIRSGQSEEGKQILESFVQNYRDPGFSLADGLSDEECLNILFDQKRIELWGEGQLFFDYKRLNKGVDRYHITSGENIWSSNSQFITNGRPAWMNMYLPSTYYLETGSWSRKTCYTGLEGFYNPDPSGCYISGTSDLADKKQYLGSGYYASALIENFSSENNPPVYRSVSYYYPNKNPDLLYVSLGEGEEMLTIETKDGQYVIPEQTVSFNGESFTIKAEGGILKDHTITFYSDGLWLQSGEKTIEATIKRSEGISFFLPDKDLNFQTTVYLTFGSGITSNPMSVIQKDGKNYLRLYVKPPVLPENASARFYFGAVVADTFTASFGIYGTDIYETDYSNYLQNGCPYKVVQDGAEGSYVACDFTQETQGQYIEVPIEGQLTGEEQNILVFQMTMLNGAVYRLQETSICYPEYFNLDEDIHFLSNQTYADWLGKVQDLESETDAYVSVSQGFGEHVDEAYAFVVPAEMTREEALLAFKEKRYEMVQFEEMKHKYSTTFALRIPVRERGTLKVAVVAVSGGEAKKVAFSETFDYKTWKSLGMGLFTDDGWMVYAPYEVEYQQNILDPTRFRIVKPYSSVYAAEGWTGETPSEYLNFRILQPGEELNGVTITQKNLVVFDDCVTGFYHENYEATLILCHPSDFSSTSTSEEDYMYNCVESYQENGLPAMVKIAPWWYMNGVGGFNCFTEQLVELVFPGVSKYSCKVRYVGSREEENNTYTVATCTLFSAAASAKLALIRGEISSDIDAAVEGIANGSIEAVGVTADKQEYKVLMPADAVNERYTLVLVAFDAAGKVLSFDTKSFDYVAPGPATEEWNPAYVGTFRYTLFFGSEEKPYDDEGLTLWQSSLNPNRYKIGYVFDGVDFIFEMAEDGTISFDNQFTGYTDSKYGEVYVTDMYQSNPDRFEPSRYENGVFNFSIGYCVEDGYFGYGTETFTITGQPEAKTEMHLKSMFQKALEVREDIRPYRIAPFLMEPVTKD